MKKKLSLILFLFALNCFLALTTQAQTTVFTYQGRLTDTSMAANGTYDFQFALFDAPTGGTPQGATQTITGVSVTNGIFTVQLDFGSAPFQTGADRYLEIAVKRPAADTTYTSLTPRQRITSTPYAIRSLLAGTADNAQSLNGQPAGSYVLTTDSRLSDSRIPTSGSNFYIQNQNVTTQTADFKINGSGTTGSLTVTNNALITGTQTTFNGANGLVAGGAFGSGAIPA